MYFLSSVIIKVSEDPSVLSKKSVYIPDKIVCIPVKTVVIIVPALIGTEFLISTTANGISAIETFLFHSTKVLIKIQKNVFKRIQMTLIDYVPGIID